LLEGKNVNLRIMEKEDFPLFIEWYSKSEFWGEFVSPLQRSRTELEKAISEPGQFEWKDFLIEKKDGTKIGWISFYYAPHPMGKTLEIGYSLIPNERRKGYCTEASQIMVDYLFLSKEAPCIQAITHVRNTASQRVLEKVGFKREGIMRKRSFVRGEWTDMVLFSILREEWKEPKILTKTWIEPVCAR
jgi:ribosomal-protein-alanine N-acetyltransferase